MLYISLGYCCNILYNCCKYTDNFSIAQENKGKLYTSLCISTEAGYMEGRK